MSVSWVNGSHLVFYSHRGVFIDGLGLDRNVCRVGQDIPHPPSPHRVIEILLSIVFCVSCRFFSFLEMQRREQKEWRMRGYHQGERWTMNEEQVRKEGRKEGRDY